MKCAHPSRRDCGTRDFALQHCPMIYMEPYLLGRLNIVGAHFVEFLEEVKRRLAVINIRTVLHLVALREVVGRKGILYVEGGLFLNEGKLGQLRRSGGNAGSHIFAPNGIECSLRVVVD